MPIVESSIRIRAPKEQLFALTQDYYLRLEWDPFVSAIQFLDGAKEAAVGVRVLVKSKRGLTMEVEYTTVESPHRVAIKMLKGSFFFQQFAGAWRFVDAPPDQTTVHFRYSFQTRWRLLRWAIDPVIRRVFLRDIEARLRGLKHAAETTDILKRLPTKP
jgi:ribosome-associated toxin RatA of RatAB toxin-antitoxin module